MGECLIFKHNTYRHNIICFNVYIRPFNEIHKKSVSHITCMNSEPSFL